MPVDTKLQRKRRRPVAGYEQRDANAKWIFGIVAFLAFAGFMMHLVIAGVQERFGKKPAPTDPWTGLQRQAASDEQQSFPRLQLQPPEDLKTFRAREEAELNSYGWIDRTAGVVRLPIDRAMELLLEKGLPTRDAGGHDQLGTSSYELQQQKARATGPLTEGEGK